MQKHLGLDLPAYALRKVLDRTRRDAMAENADHFFPNSEGRMFKDNAQFFVPPNWQARFGEAKVFRIGWLVGFKFKLV